MFQVPAASPPKASSPPAAAVPPIAAREVPLATPVDVPSALPVFDDRPTLSARRRRRTGLPGWGAWLAVLLVVLLCIGVGLALWLRGPDSAIVVSYFGNGSKTDTGPSHESAQFNYRFTLPPKPWEHDHETRITAKANLLAMRRSNPEAWIALAAQDYQERTPGDAETVKEAVRRLRHHFKESLEYEPAGDGQLGGQPAQRIIFQGSVKHVLMSGECFILKHQGIVYWFMTWAPSSAVQQLRSEFAGLRRGFALLNDGEAGKDAPKTKPQR